MAREHNPSERKERALQAAQGDLTGAAEKAGVSEDTVRHWMRELGILPVDLENEESKQRYMLPPEQPVDILWDAACGCIKDDQTIIDALLRDGASSSPQAHANVLMSIAEQSENARVIGCAIEHPNMAVTSLVLMLHTEQFEQFRDSITQQISDKKTILDN